MQPTNPQPIIIKKKKTHSGHHGGAWKVAYADFVTAMMALFIVLWLLSSSERVKKAVGGYFLDPQGKGHLTGSNSAGIGESLSVRKDDLSQLKKKIEQAIRSVPELKEMQEHIRLTITGEGLRIELLETEQGMFFDSGSPNPNARCILLLQSLAAELGKLPNTVLIEGHTDSKPYSGSRTYTNWHLSADRANAALLVMHANGLRPTQVKQVRGFADQNLFRPDAPFDPANRRVSVIVQYTTEQPQTTGVAVK
jgi:chemotaxis protein MotB